MSALEEWGELGQGEGGAEEVIMFITTVMRVLGRREREGMDGSNHSEVC